MKNENDELIETVDEEGNIYNETGYMTDYRLNSSGGISAAAGAIHSGYIEYNNEVIRIYGTTDATPGYSGNYIVFYDSAGTKLIQYAFNTLVENNCTWENVNDKYLYTAFFGLFIFIDIFSMFLP